MQSAGIKGKKVMVKFGKGGEGVLMVTATPHPKGAKGPGQVASSEGHTGS